MNNILITGGAGFIGRHLVHRLLSENTGCNIVIIDNLSNNNKKSYRNNSFDKRIKFYRQDIRNTAIVSDIFKRERIDTCVHLAAKVSVADSIINPVKTIDVNVNGTLSVLEACTKHGVEKFVFASSAAVYGEPKTLPIPEDHVLDPLSPYGAGKAASEMLVASYNHCKKIATCISLRFFNVYGEGQNPEYAGVITRFGERLAKGLPPMIYGDGKQTRDFIHVSDVVDSLILAADSKTSGAYNIGTGHPVSIFTLARMSMNLCGHKMEPIYYSVRQGEVKESYADTRRSKKVLRFSPKMKLERGLSQFLRDRLQQSIPSK